MDSEEHVCPACGQPVETVVKRHKTLGAWVPVWVAGPCRNPKCETHVEEGAEGSDEEHRKTSEKGPVKETGKTATKNS
ncbi:hypothetical protein [Streptomyces curacoi]|uniref:Uncharacterized protein n=1 Tax=Streptomyces curacoi TaxID=146536 RepID=A0A117P0H6_9ACTN|nr:hypothetical protein [Streptomyces curacoi]KUM70762.1 hypothetical protein AQI70_28890 [Streptomyces curacoi]